MDYPVIVTRVMNFQKLQGVPRLVIQLWLLISLAYVDNMKYPLNHSIIYKGEFFWHIKHHDHFISSWVKSKNVFDKVFPEMVSVFSHRIPISLCFELDQIWAHIYYTNGPHFVNKCGLRFGLAQSIAKLGFCVKTQKPFLGKPCQKHFWTQLMN